MAECRDCHWLIGENKGSYKKRRPNDAAVRIEEQRSIIRFLTAAGEKPAAIHWWMVTVYGEKCVSDKSVRKWSARFRAGRKNVGDDQRPGQQTLSSRAISSTRWTTTEETPKREALQLGRRTQGH
ncbi:HTH_48 domain-containing protein [Trichonephila inaurata madagascariensis]|uniref:HTH_48 domain-containing protein n=1 Tax=Trichonephila inaurata madagascariensis TaxID=2747483 RepID=A0A8X6WM85_9ARAC|nr:HTH_48 domain-containing protein [Trichonephila inaurata madagascariensis]